MNFVMVGIGAAFGVSARALVTNWIKRKSSYTFPFATFVVNMTGSLLLGFLTGLAVGESLSLLLVTGFMGSFTTFSTFHVENVELMQKEKYKHLFGYIGISCVLGVVLVFAGLAVGNIVKP